jgi:hypothetical protein
MMMIERTMRMNISNWANAPCSMAFSIFPGQTIWLTIGISKDYKRLIRIIDTWFSVISIYIYDFFENSFWCDGRFQTHNIWRCANFRMIPFNKLKITRKSLNDAVKNYLPIFSFNKTHEIPGISYIFSWQAI